MRARHRHFSHRSIGATCCFDARKINQSSGSVVSQWDDISGNGIHVTQSNNTYRPTFQSAQAGFGGNGVVRFDGTDDYLRSSGTTWIGKDSFTVFCVVSGGQSSANQERGVFAEDNGSTAGYLSGVWLERNNTATAGNSNAYVASYNKGSAVVLPLTGFPPQILLFRKIKDSSVSHFINGSLSGTETTSGTIVTNGTASAYPVRLGITDKYHIGDMAFVAAAATAISHSLRKRLEHAAAYSFKLSCN